MSGINVKERYDSLYNYPVGEEPGTNYSGASDLYTGGMNKSLTGSLIMGGAALAGSAINYFSNRENNQANREMQQEANRQNEDLWRMQTEYNTPANQIARLRQANLNPNLIYGNPTNTAASAPEMKASKNERYQLDPMAMANVMLMSKQIQNLEADNAVKQAESKNIDANTRGIELDNIRKDFENSKQGQRYEREVRKFEQDYQYVYNEMLLIAQQVFTERKKGQLFDSQKTAQDLENSFNKAVESERIQQFITQGKISKQQLSNLQKEWQKLCVEIDNIGKQGKILDQKRLFDELNNIVFASQNWGSLKNSPITYYTDKETGELKIVARGMTNLDSNEGAYVVLEFLKEVISAFNGGGLKYTNISGNSKTTTIDNSTNNRNY